jgi:hypothetical protein
MTNLPEEFAGGEHVLFSKPDGIKLLLKAKGLQEAYKTRQIVLPSSCNKAVVSKNVHFVMSGLKINDRRALTPVTKWPLFLARTDGGKPTSLVQLFENSIPLDLMISMEKPDVVEFVLEETFDKYRHEDELTDTDPSRLLGDDYLPLHIPCNTDIKMHWAGTGLEGDAKVHKQPCHYCVIQSNDLAKGNVDQCGRFCGQ